MVCCCVKGRTSKVAAAALHWTEKTEFLTWPVYSFSTKTTNTFSVSFCGLPFWKSPNTLYVCRFSRNFFVLFSYSLQKWNGDSKLFLHCQRTFFHAILILFLFYNSHLFMFDFFCLLRPSLPPPLNSISNGKEDECISRCLSCCMAWQAKRSEIVPSTPQVKVHLPPEI